MEDVLDQLYSAAPEEFTALRGTLAAAAKKDGDTDAARRISGCRKPTTAAWVVNRLAIIGSARSELAELGSKLRQAHSSMDGDAIRALTAEQRALVDRLTRSAFADADLPAPSGALRDDVTATLQAAIADPEVAERLGRLTKAERWSGFGEFGFSAAVAPAPRKAAPKSSAPKASAPKSSAPKPDGRAAARAELAAAERARADADAALSELQADLAAARLRHDDAKRRLATAEQALSTAEQALSTAEQAYADGKQISRDAADAVKKAKRAVGR
ncbi:hypothetical protein MPP7335_00674 [Mycolicibacterium parafortuitum]|uniref:Uncharacterized protein n=1 Tax=Mycolicibacterium parafortuitum TaxID=39692 RepID=A0A375YCV5_MYCPF|nr:hypothetical protein MPP7335_00674 [Mycolicibacterium parafortuitum]